LETPAQWETRLQALPGNGGLITPPRLHPANTSLFPPLQIWKFPAEANSFQASFTCRKEFIPRPELVKNIMLAALVEDLKKTGLQTAAADHCYAGPEDVACDDILRDTWRNIKLKITEVEVLLSETEPKTRREFLQYFQELTLDPNTAHKKLLLSEENRKCKCIRQEQSYPDHPDRFSDHKQALSRESLTGRCYWEVEWTGRLVGVGVSYKDTSRTEVFGQNDKSWCLYCDLVCNVFYHNNVVTSLPSSDFATIGVYLDHRAGILSFYIKTPVSGPVSSRIGVYLDHRAGILSFYSVSETMTLLHRVQTRFTQPLYAGVRPLFSKDSVEAQVCLEDQ
uniref:B30.2/SPRY domain-containing protein n=1 Tax=Xiphophorus couchianus TaxID=32473 RepID=A0A3B5LHG8_9TELE